jgi:hypothetical protein
MQMRHRWSFTVLAPIALLIVASSHTVAGQDKPAAAGAARESSYKVPRTADGQPDLQGYWTTLSYTPVERPRELANKPFYTEQEAIDAFNKAAAGRQDALVHYVRSDFGATPAQTGARPNLRTSMVIDPPDGRIPALTPEAQKRVAQRRQDQATRSTVPLTWNDDRGARWCVFMDSGAVPFLPDVYGSVYNVVQSKDWVAIVYEWNNERRLIPLDGRPHTPSSVRTYAGNSRGHWDGDTLVIETTNFSPNWNFRGSEGGFTLVERLTRVDADTIDYQFTVNDPATWTKPWTAALPMQRIQGPMLEYACNENNQDVFESLRNARALEQGKVAAPDVVKNGNAKAVITERNREDAERGKTGDRESAK